MPFNILVEWSSAHWTANLKKIVPIAENGKNAKSKRCKITRFYSKSVNG